MKRGPLPKTQRQHAVAGNPGKRAPKVEPDPAAPSTSKPPITLNAEARAIWDAIVPELIRIRTLSIVELRYAARACRWEAIGDGQLALAEKTPTAETKANGLQPSGHMKAAAFAYAEADRFWFRSGVTAAERARLATRDPKTPEGETPPATKPATGGPSHGKTTSIQGFLDRRAARTRTPHA